MSAVRSTCDLWFYVPVSLNSPKLSRFLVWSILLKFHFSQFSARIVVLLVFPLAVSRFSPQFSKLSTVPNLSTVVKFVLLRNSGIVEFFVTCVFTSLSFVLTSSRTDCVQNAESGCVAQTVPRRDQADQPAASEFVVLCDADVTSKGRWLTCSCCRLPMHLLQMGNWGYILYGLCTKICCTWTKDKVRFLDVFGIS